MLMFSLSSATSATYGFNQRQEGLPDMNGNALPSFGNVAKIVRQPGASNTSATHFTCRGISEVS